MTARASGDKADTLLPNEFFIPPIPSISQQTCFFVMGTPRPKQIRSET